MKLFATSDLHLDQRENFLAFQTSLASSDLAHTHDNCLILAGDICETEEQLKQIFHLLRPRYREIIWTPGNHELWIRPSQQKIAAGSEAKYRRMLEICKAFSVHTPEDEFLIIEGNDETLAIVPMFLLYDYSFRPDFIPEHQAVEWAMESNVLCTDEVLIKTAEHSGIADWCRKRFEYTRTRIESFLNEKSLQAGKDLKLILINHFPLCEASFHLTHIPRFSIWCGTRLTQDWHKRYPVAKIISGHLHMSGVQNIDGVEFYEVSLGYPGQWDSHQNMLEYFVPISI